MAKKKKAEEHENLERWLVSYADFITLLFATFVVLYALSQVDISEYMKLEESMRAAFSPPSLLSGMESIIDGSESNSPIDSKSGDSVVSPLMLEFVSAAYEQQSFEEIEAEITQKEKKGELKGVSAKITDRGLLLTLSEDIIFNQGSATLNPKSVGKVNMIGDMIAEKFLLHYIRVEGHSDNTPMSQGYVYPSNWELSSARASTIIRHFIKRNGFIPALFSAVGYADTRPLEDNNTPEGKAKNRRVDILILRNKYKLLEQPKVDLMTMSKEEQEDLLKQRGHKVKRLKGLSEAAKELAKEDPAAAKHAIMMKHEGTEKMELNPGNKLLYDNDNAPLKAIDEKMFDADFHE